MNADCAPFFFRMISVENKKEDMKTLCTLIERGGFSGRHPCLSASLTSKRWKSGALRPYVDSTHEFGSTLDAYDRILTGRATGKVIVKVE